jgi:hypothetical protein
MLSVPARLDGAITVNFVELVTLVTVAEVPPKVTEVTVVKFVPLIVTFVFVVAGPSFGETEVTVGAAISGPDEMVNVIVALYVPEKAFAGMDSHQSVASVTAPMPVVVAALAKMLGAGAPPKAVPVTATGYVTELCGSVQLEPVAQVAFGRALLFAVIDEPLKLSVEVGSLQGPAALQELVPVRSVIRETDAERVHPAPEPVASMAVSVSGVEMFAVTPGRPVIHLAEVGPSIAREPADTVAVPMEVQRPDGLVLVQGFDKAGEDVTSAEPSARTPAMSKRPVPKWGLRAFDTGPPLNGHGNELFEFPSNGLRHQLLSGILHLRRRSSVSWKFAGPRGPGCSIAATRRWSPSELRTTLSEATPAGTRTATGEGLRPAIFARSSVGADRSVVGVDNSQRRVLPS